MTPLAERKQNKNGEKRRKRRWKGKNKKGRKEYKIPQEE
jgi:hypothetical protein